MKTDIGCFETLKSYELEEVESNTFEQNEKIIVSGYADFISSHMVFFTGNKKCYIAPFDMFLKREMVPDFDQLSILDRGRTIKLGNYHAESELLLKELCN